MIIIKKYRVGEKKKFGNKLFSFHSMAYSQKSLENKKSFAKNKGFEVRSRRELTGWSFWTRKGD